MLDNIPPGLVFVMRCQLSPTQVKCICNANDSTYILHGSLITMRYIECPVSELCKRFKKISFWDVKRLFKYSLCKIYCVVCPDTTKKCLVEYSLKDPIIIWVVKVLTHMTTVVLPFSPHYFPISVSRQGVGVLSFWWQYYFSEWDPIAILENSMGWGKWKITDRFSMGWVKKLTIEG